MPHGLYGLSCSNQLWISHYLLCPLNPSWAHLCNILHYWNISKSWNSKWWEESVPLKSIQYYIKACSCQYSIDLYRLWEHRSISVCFNTIFSNHTYTYTRIYIYTYIYFFYIQYIQYSYTNLTFEVLWWEKNFVLPSNISHQ